MVYRYNVNTKIVLDSVEEVKEILIEFIKRVCLALTLVGSLELVQM